MMHPWLVIGAATMILPMYVAGLQEISLTRYMAPLVYMAAPMPDDLDREARIDEPAPMPSWEEVAAVGTGSAPAEKAVQPRVSVAPLKPELLMRSKDWNWSRRYKYAIAEGRVKNISAYPINNVEVVVQWSTADGTFITSSSSLIDYRPILPGQSSPWKVYGTWNPAMSGASVSFKRFSGGTIWTDRTLP